MNIDLTQITALAQLAADKNLAEITVTDGDQSVTIKTPASVAQTVVAGGAYAPAPSFAPAAAAAPVSAPSSEAAPPPAAVESANTQTITSPMVGTFYAASSPDKPAFVSVGQTISAGQTLCILEAMKQMNELEAEISGKVVAILATNGQPVEYGQPLFKVEV